MSQRRAALVAVTVMIVLAAGTYSVAKRALEDVASFPLAMIRFTGSAAVFAGILLVFRPRLPRGRTWLRLWLLGVLAVVGNQTCFLYGMRWTTPTHAALIYALTPITVVLLERGLLGTRAGRHAVAGIGVALAGTLIVLAPSGDDLAAGAVRGDALVLAAMVCWALYTVLGKPVVERLGSVATTAWSILLGFATILPFGLPTLVHAPYATFSPAVWFGAAYLIGITSVVCYGLWYWALARLEPSRMAVFNNLQPPLAAAISWFATGEQVGWSLVVGGVLIVAGVLGAQRR